MKEKVLLGTNVLCFLLLALIAATIQTSLWFQIMGYFPGPALWIPVIVFVSMHRKNVEMLIVLSIIALILSSMSSMSDGVTLISVLLLGLGARFFKERIFWVGGTYSMLICGLSSFFFHFIKWCAASYLEEKQFFMPDLLDWIIEAMLTSLLSPFIFRLMEWLDGVFGRETGAGIAGKAL